MPSVNLFLLLPESTPTIQWMNGNEDFHSEFSLRQFLVDLELKLDSIKLENYNGFYDADNVSNFLENIDILEDYYPFPARRLLSRTIIDFYNWRLSSRQNNLIEYFAFNQSITNHSFCEIAERINTMAGDKFLILNHYAHNITTSIDISFNFISVNLPSVSTSIALIIWFAQNRIPERDFHIIPKHGENRHFIRKLGGKNVSPLKCSRDEAKILLKQAIGNSLKELFNIDHERSSYIVFKYEGDNGHNLYHGYHVPLDSTEVPNSIKAIISSRNYF